MGLETIFRSSLCLPNQNYQILEEWHSGQGLAQGHGWEEAGGARLGAGGFLALSRGGFPTMTLLADPIQPEHFCSSAEVFKALALPSFATEWCACPDGFGRVLT